MITEGALAEGEALVVGAALAAVVVDSVEALAAEALEVAVLLGVGDLKYDLRGTNYELIHKLFGAGFGGG